VELLVLGGSSFVGRAAVEDGLRRGWRVTTFNRGSRPAVAPDVEALAGDRLAPDDLAVLGGRRWDVVADTWAGAPRAVRDSATALRGAADRYAYVSSGSVYAPPPRIGGDESAPVVEASPDFHDGDYPERKRGAELAVSAAFGDRALLARAGTILGLHEDVGRLPWWLLRLARGGEVLAPGPPDLPLQLIDARDLAAWLLHAAVASRSGPFNAVSRAGARDDGWAPPGRARGHRVGRHADLGGAGAVERAGIEAWTELPIWLPPDHPYRGLHAALAAWHAAPA
jgi:2'-hydroxyisoflavone reductase